MQTCCATMCQNLKTSKRQSHLKEKKLTKKLCRLQNGKARLKKISLSHSLLPSKRPEDLKAFLRQDFASEWFFMVFPFCKNLSSKPTTPEIGMTRTTHNEAPALTEKGSLPTGYSSPLLLLVCIRKLQTFQFLRFHIP